MNDDNEVKRQHFCCFEAIVEFRGDNFLCVGRFCVGRFFQGSPAARSRASIISPVNECERLNKNYNKGFSPGTLQIFGHSKMFR